MMKILSALLVMMISLAAPAMAGPLDHLNGRWTGWGRLYTSGGMSEQLNCTTTYKASNGGLEAVQKFRCTSPGYRFNAIVDYAVVGNGVSGTWREQIYSVGGSFDGGVQAGRIQMEMRAQTFEASVSIKSDLCAQNINIRLRGGVDIDRMDIKLKRC